MIYVDLLRMGYSREPGIACEAQGRSEGASVMLAAARAQQVERLVRTNVILCAERAIACMVTSVYVVLKGTLPVIDPYGLMEVMRDCTH